MKNKIALFSLLFFVVLTVSCSNKTEKDFFKEAQKHLARQEYQKAVNTYITIMEKFPDGKYAPRAALEIAKLYHGNAIKNITKKESLTIAVKYYLTVHSLIPKTEEGASALFMAAFIEANELKDFNKAKEYYNRFINEYPESPLVNSAKIEIKNLGIPPEKIIEKKIEK